MRGAGSLVLYGLCLWGLSGVGSFQAPYPRQTFTQCNKNGDVVRDPFRLMEKEEAKDIDIGAVSKEVDDALAAAKKALEASQNEVPVVVPPQTPIAPPPVRPPPKAEVIKTPPPPKPPKLDPVAQKKQEKLQGESVAASVGGGLLGAAVGLGVLVATDVPAGLGLDSDAAFAIPVVTTVLLASAAGLTAGQDNFVGTISRGVFAKPVTGFGDAVIGGIKRSLRNTFKAIVGFPGKVVDSIKKSVKETTDEIVSLPGRAATKVKDEVTAIPGKVKTAAGNQIKKVEDNLKAIPSNVASSVKRTTDATVAEIKATPGRIADSARQTVTSAVESVEKAVEETVEEIASIPGKAVKAVGEMAEDIVEDISAFPKDIASKLSGSLKGEAPQQTQSQPPLSPIKSPSPPEQRSEMRNLELPSLELPKVDVPKVEFPKVELPKASLPKVGVIKIPETPKASKPPPKIRAPPSPESVKKSSLVSALMKKQAAAKAEQEKLAAARAVEERKKAAEAKKVEEAKKVAAARAMEEKEGAAAREAEAKKKAAERARLAAEEKAQEEAEQKRQATLRAKQEAEQRKVQMEAKAAEVAKRAEAAAQKAIKEKQRLSEVAAQKAEDEKQRQIREAKAASAAKQKTAPAAESAPPKRNVATRAPRGVPTIVRWRLRKDKGITGAIYGSPNFEEGDRVETTPIVSGSIENGSIVKTGSGSRYFLSDTPPAGAPDKGALKTLLAALPGATITLTREAKDRDARKAKEALEQMPPARKTFSLFGLIGGDSSDEPTAKTEPKQSTPSAKPTKKAPAGVPTITKWRKNRDGSITGLIFGSSSFGEGERVTTSPIAQGDLDSGNVVRTGSGSRYFLD